MARHNKKAEAEHDRLRVLYHQYRTVSAHYGLAVVFLQDGDRWLTFDTDAKRCQEVGAYNTVEWEIAPVFGSREESSFRSVPVLAVPDKDIHPLISKLLDAGQSVAMCQPT